MVGSAIVRELERQGYTNIITRTHKELDLTRQDAVEAFFAEEKPEYDDGYRSILDDDDEDEAEEVADYEQTISHSQLHHIGHADMPAAEDEKKDEEDKE